MRALEAAEKPDAVVIEVKPDDEGEGLVSVNTPPPPDDPRAFGGR